MRTFLNLTMAIGAFVSIVLFRGFSNFLIDSMSEQITQGRSGHIQVASTAIWNGDIPDKKELAYLADPDLIKQKIMALPGVGKASGRADVPVLLSNGDKTIGAIALGFDPKIEDNIEKALIIDSGTGFSKTSKDEVLVSAGLQNNLQLKTGQTLSVVGQSLSGSINSLELEVRGIVKSGFTDVDNSTIYIPLEAAQSLLGTKRVERVAVLLNPDVDLEKSLAAVKDTIRDQKDIAAKDWKEAAVLFRQVTEFWDVQNLVVEVILMMLVFFGILNTIGMSIYERIGEIGTMRALGDQSSEVLALLLCEGLLLGLVSLLIGVPLTAAIAAAFSSLGMLVPLPGTSAPVPVAVLPVARDYVVAGLAVVGTCFISSLWPAMKAVRLSITDALRANS